MTYYRVSIPNSMEVRPWHKIRDSVLCIVHSPYTTRESFITFLLTVPFRNLTYGDHSHTYLGPSGCGWSWDVEGGEGDHTHTCDCWSGGGRQTRVVRRWRQSYSYTSLRRRDEGDHGLGSTVHVGRRNGTDDRVRWFVSSMTVVGLLQETDHGG